jgi:hypothetical protein
MYNLDKRLGGGYSHVCRGGLLIHGIRTSWLNVEIRWHSNLVVEIK